VTLAPSFAYVPPLNRQLSKGLYKKARRAGLKTFTGIDSPYEPPERPEIRIDTTIKGTEDAAESIAAHLRKTAVLTSISCLG